MRRAIVGFVVCAGCNPVFGLHETKQQDAYAAEAIPLDAAPPMVLLTKLIVDTDPQGMATIDRDSPLAAAPPIQIGLLGQPLESRAYADGGFVIPDSFIGNAWRMVTTLDGRDHEYQWKVGSGHVSTALSVGNPAPAPVAQGAGYMITPAGLSPTHQYQNVEFFTSGVWTDTHRVTTSANSTFSIDFSQVAAESEPLLGPLGKPEPARGDWQLLVELPAGAAACHAAIGAAWQSRDLGIPTAPPWQTQTAAWPAVTFSDTDPATRMLFVLGQRWFTDGSPSPSGGVSTFGYVPKGGLPSFNRTKRPGVSDLAIDRPLMVNLAECTGFPLANPPAAFVDVPELASRMTRANYAQLTSTRRVSGDTGACCPDVGPDVTSSLQAISTDSSVVFAAPLARTIKLDQQDLQAQVGGTPGAPDYAVTIAATPARTLDLTFSDEDPTATIQTADDYVVTLYAIKVVSARPAVVPVRVFHVTSGIVHIDSAVFTGLPGKFIVEITSRKGVPDAKDGDFTTLTYPYSTATVWSYAFTVTP